MTGRAPLRGFTTGRLSTPARRKGDRSEPGSRAPKALSTFETRDGRTKVARDAKTAAILFARDTGKTTVELRQFGRSWAGPYERWTVVNGEAKRAT